MNDNFLCEVLAAAGEVEVIDINEKISNIVDDINTLKLEVKNEMEEKYINFNPVLKENETLRLKAKVLSESMYSLQNKINGQVKKELVSTTTELKDLSASLHEANYHLQILSQLLEIESSLKSAMNCMDNKLFFDSTVHLIHAKSIKNNLSKSLEDLELNIMKPLSDELLVMHEQLIYNITEVWGHCVSFQRKESESVKKVTCSVDTSMKEEICQVVKALASLKYKTIETRLQEKLMKEIFLGIMSNKSVLTVHKENTVAVLTVSVITNENSQYLEVFQNLEVVIGFLLTHLNAEIEPGFNFISKLGDSISQEFTQNLIEKCLSETIPTNSDDLESYSLVIQNVETFQNCLQETGFLPYNCTSLIEYAKNVNVLFANKFCQFYLEKARNIMKKDLHDTVFSPDVIIITDHVIQVEEKRRDFIEELNINVETNNGENVFHFPKCQISKSAEELLNLVYSVMDEVGKSQDMCAVRLFYTVRNIFELYSAIVPLHHKKFLETLPQQVALFHNNCLYFTHRLLTLPYDYKDKLPGILKEHSATFLDQALTLRKLGNETLETFVMNQKSQLVYILRDSGLATLNENPKLQPNTEKSIRQCIRQLQLLQTVWQNVLPANVYSNIMGFLLNGVTEEIINLVSSAEDISSDTATELVGIFSIILERTPLLFEEPKEINRHTKRWQKFKEFVMILGASLKDINERWADGMGPLSHEFTPEQVKHFIRALFQNTERRAALLARIK